MIGQKKMFKNPLPAVFHFFIYAGFILINIEVLEIILDGILGTHRLFVPFLGSFYSILISFFESLAWLVIIASLARAGQDDTRGEGSRGRAHPGRPPGETFRRASISSRRLLVKGDKKWTFRS